MTQDVFLWALRESHRPGMADRDGRTLFAHFRFHEVGEGVVWTNILIPIRFVASPLAAAHAPRSDRP